MDRFYPQSNNNCSANSGYTNDDFYGSYDNSCSRSGITAAESGRSCSITNTATAKGYYYPSASAEPAYVNGEDSITIGCILADIEKTADRDSASAGDRIKYTITFRNMSDREMYNVKIADQLPVSLNVIATSISPFPQPGESLADGISLGRVAPGAAKSLTFTATVADDVSEDIVNRAFADFNFRDSKGREQSASTPITSVTTTVENTGITVTKTADRSYVTAKGEEVEFAITVTNNASYGISDLVVTDSLPADLAYVKNTTSINGAKPIDADPSGGIYIGELASGAKVVVKFAASVNI